MEEESDSSMDGPATAAASPAPPKKKPRRTRKSGLGTSDLVFRAVSATTDRKGMSFVALKKELAAQGYDVDNNIMYIKRCIKILLSKGLLLQSKGTGASGSYKANKKAEWPKSVEDKAAAKKPKAGKPVSAKKTPVQKASKSSKKKET